MTRALGILAVLAVLGLLALGIWILWTNPGPKPVSAEAQAEKERNWIWRPTAEDLKRAERAEGGALHVRGPIVDEETGEPLTGQVYINGELVADGVQEVDVLMWGTEERPVFLRVEASGHAPWEMRFRFHKEGLGELSGPIRLKPEEEAISSEGATLPVTALSSCSASRLTDSLRRPIHDNTVPRCCGEHLDLGSQPVQNNLEYSAIYWLIQMPILKIRGLRVITQQMVHIRKDV